MARLLLTRGQAWVYLLVQPLTGESQGMLKIIVIGLITVVIAIVSYVVNAALQEDRK